MTSGKNSTGAQHDPQASPTVDRTTIAALTRLRVADAMHVGLVSCPPTTPLRTVARMMATYRVHAILVPDPTAEATTDAWRVITDADLLRGAFHGEFETGLAGATAVSPGITVDSEDDLGGAARLMLTLGVAHLIVVEHKTSKPIGVLSTLDVARALAGFPERHPAAF